MATYTVDFLHSSVNFTIKHMMFTKVNGTFDSFTAQIEAEEIETLKNSTIRFALDVASVNTRDASRDNHLVSADFFHADRFPKMTFDQTSIEKVNEQLKLHGNLTIKGVTKPVTFNVSYNGRVKSPWEAEAYSFSCTTTINRKDFGLTYNAAIEAGGLLIDELVTINVELQLNILS